MPSELASLWCSLDVPDLAELVDWECQRRRAFARRWQSFLPLLDADAAMLRDALAKAAWQGATARGLVTRLTLSFLETYRAYASHPKVRAVRATLAAEGFRDKVRLASRGPMIEVEGGSFERGCTEGTRGCEPDEVPLRSVYLSSFAIDEFEVSERDYAYCVRSGICKPRRPEQCYAYDPDRGFASGRGATLGAGNRPATCVSWQQAAQYCRWIGGRLPTEAEWERAARGRKERAYPWSDATGEDPVGCDHANHFACGERLLPVDAPLLGRSPNGIAHLAGNAAEWVSDYYGPYRRGSNPRGPRAPSTTARAA